MKNNEFWLTPFLVLFIVLSLSLTIWGANKGNNIDIYSILATVGSAFLGVSIGMYLNRLIINKKETDTISMIEKNMIDFKRAVLQDDLLTSKNEDIYNILGEWHQYNVTTKKGQHYWIHAIYDIKSTPLGEILFSVKYKDNKGSHILYQYTGFIRDDRVILVGSPKDKQQPCFIEIWPHLTNHVSEYHSGFCFNQSWDQNETLIPCLLSRKPLTNRKSIDNDKLDNLWKDNIIASNISLLPRVIKSNEKEE